MPKGEESERLDGKIGWNSITIFGLLCFVLVKYDSLVLVTIRNYGCY